MSVTEGSYVRCVYCGGVVAIDDVQEEGGEVVYCEGHCQNCKRRVDYDYEPVEL